LDFEFFHIYLYDAQCNDPRHWCRTHVLAFDFKRCWFGTTFCTYYDLSLSTLKGKNIGEGAAFTGMMRQLEDLWYRYYHYFYYSIYTKHQVDLIANLDGSSFEINKE
jgi:hypothetical protein